MQVTISKLYFLIRVKKCPICMTRGSRGGRLRNDAVAITDECSPCQYQPTRDLRAAEAGAGMSVLCIGSTHVWKEGGRVFLISYFLSPGKV